MSIFQLIRSSLGLSISIALMLGCVLICSFFLVLMSRSGASPRPIYWFAGFFALVVIPQFIGHLYQAIETNKFEAPRIVALEQLTAERSANANNRSMDAQSLFGADVDPQLVTDVRAAYGAVFAAADFAQFAVLPNGETVLIARFNTATDTENAWVNYLRVAGLQTGGTGDSQRGYAVTRPQGDRLYALPFGTMMGVWTGVDDANIRARMMTAGFDIPSNAPLAGDASASNASQPEKSMSFLQKALIGTAFLIYLFIVVFYFFKGSGWAGTSLAKAGVAPLSAIELTQRLEAINTLDVPFHIERGAQPNELFATWHYADAKWIDLQRAHGVKRTLRIRMLLDEKAHTVRATDFVASYDWSAGQGGANLEWKTGFGIVFFQYEHQRVFGLQLDDQGRFKPALSYAYTFNLQEMKSPLIEASTCAGWDWRPTVWHGPAWLRWLTE